MNDRSVMTSRKLTEKQQQHANDASFDVRRRRERRLCRPAFARHRDDARAVAVVQKLDRPARRVAHRPAPRVAPRVRQMFVDRDSGAQEDSVPESTRRTLRYDAGWRARRGRSRRRVRSHTTSSRARARVGTGRATQPAVRLDGDWIQTMDTASGDLYYCNLSGSRRGNRLRKFPRRRRRNRVVAGDAGGDAAVGRAGAVRKPRFELDAAGDAAAGVVPKRFGKPRDALPSATRPWGRFSKRASLAAKGGASFAERRDTPPRRSRL